MSQRNIPRTQLFVVLSFTAVAFFVPTRAAALHGLGELPGGDGDVLGSEPSSGTKKEGKRGSNGKKTEHSTNYEKVDFLLDGGSYHNRNRPVGLLPFPRMNFLFVRGRFQLNRYVAIEQENRARIPVPYLLYYSVGPRGQFPVANSWSIFATARFGLQHRVKIPPPVDVPYGITGWFGEAAIGVERLASTNVLYGFEVGATKYFGWRGPYPVVPHVRWNFGYAF